MIYFDNAATSGYKPEAVIDAVTHTMKNVSANPGRSGHTLAVRAAMIVSETRELLAGFMNHCDSDSVIFTQNCTDALNLAILGSGLSGQVITTANEHNSVLRPLYELERRRKIRLTVVQPGPDGRIGIDGIMRAARQDLAMIAVNHVSNVTGAVADIAAIGKFARDSRAIMLVDGAQSGGNLPIDMRGMNIDLLAIAPHKGFHAMQGLGALLFSSRVNLRPIRYGGTGTDSVNLYQPLIPPEAFESGTLATPAIAAFSAGIKWASSDQEARREAVRKLSQRILCGLSKIRGVRLLTDIQCETGVISFNIKSMGSSEVADILNSQYEICVRPGLHCAPLIHRHFGTVMQGAVRASVSSENTQEEADFFLSAVNEIAVNQ